MKYITVFNDNVNKHKYNIVVADKCQHNITVTDNFNKSRIVITSLCESFIFRIKNLQNTFWLFREMVGFEDIRVCSYYDLDTEKYCYLFFYDVQADKCGIPLELIFKDSYNNNTILELTLNSDKKNYCT